MASERKELLWSAILAGNIDVVAMGLRDKPQYDDAKWFSLLEQSVRGWLTRRPENQQPKDLTGVTTSQF